MIHVDIVDWAEGRVPGGGFYTDRWYDADAGRWVLERAPIKLADYHKAILRHCFTLDDSGRLPYHTVCIAESAKSGKSTLSALVHQYFMLHVEPPAEQYVIGNKRDQAQSRVFRSLCQSIEWNPHLHIEPNKYELETSAGTIVKAIPANYRGESGARYTLASFDEPWAIMYQDNERLVSEFKQDPTRGVSVKLFSGYGGFATESNLWQNLLETGLQGKPVDELRHIDNGRGEPACWANGRLFVYWAHWPKMAWQTPEWIAEQRRSLRDAEFARLITVDFSEGTGGFIDAATWESLIDAALEPLRPGAREPVYIGLDLAVKPGGDDAALVGLYEHESGKIAVAFHHVWRGGASRKVDLQISETVEPVLVRAAKRSNLAMIALDPWQCMGLAQDLRRAGLPVVEIPQTHRSRGPADTALWQLARDGMLILYDDPELRAAVTSANAKELGNGQLFIQKASARGRVDLLVAMSNALAGMAVPRYTTEVVSLPLVRIV
jgi:phage terminase large subunit-like protein